MLQFAADVFECIAFHLRDHNDDEQIFLDEEIRDLLSLASTCTELFRKKFHLFVSWALQQRNGVESSSSLKLRLERLAYLAARNNEVRVLKFVINRPEYLAHLSALYEPINEERNQFFVERWVSRISSPLFAAAHHGCLDAVRMLCVFSEKNEAIFYPMGRDAYWPFYVFFHIQDHRYRALRYAARRGQVEVARYLTREIQTPVFHKSDLALYEARRSGQLGMVRFLIEEATQGHAYPDLFDNLDAFIHARMDGYQDVASYFAERAVKRMDDANLAINRARAEELGHASVEAMWMSFPMF